MKKDLSPFLNNLCVLVGQSNPCCRQPFYFSFLSFHLFTLPFTFLLFSLFLALCFYLFADNFFSFQFSFLSFIYFTILLFLLFLALSLFCYLRNFKKTKKNKIERKFVLFFFFLFWLSTFLVLKLEICIF